MNLLIRFLSDRYGNPSSKRLAGWVILFAAIVAAFVHLPESTLVIMFSSGTALLSAGVIEGFAKKDEEKHD